MGTGLNYRMPLDLDPRNTIPVLELDPNLGVWEIFNSLTTSGLGKSEVRSKAWGGVTT